MKGQDEQVLHLGLFESAGEIKRVKMYFGDPWTIGNNVAMVLIKEHFSLLV